MEEQYNYIHSQRYGISSNLLVAQCHFINNTAGGSGGALYKTGRNDWTVIDGNSYNSNTAYSLVELSMYLVQVIQSVFPEVPSSTTQQ